MNHHADVMFSPAAYARVGGSPAVSESLPPWCYTSQEFYEAEVERIFRPAWNFFGRADRIAKPGEYFSVDLVGIPTIVVRDRDGRVRAFANSCRHRGTKIVTGEGRRSVFTCPYHGWSYGLDGALRGGRGLKMLEDFSKLDYGLVEFRVELWGGFIFVNFDGTSGSLAEWLGDLPEQMASYDSENLVLCKRVEFTIDCNWKSHIENSVEDYHVPLVHASTLQQIEGGYGDTYPDTRGNWFVMREKHEGTRALLAEDSHHALPRIATLEGHAAEGTNFVCLLPSTLLAYTVDSMWYIELYPQGPRRTTLSVGMCFPAASVARPDFTEKAQYYYKRWVKAVSEDNAITEMQLAGMSSPYARAGRLTPLEPVIPKMGRWWIDCVVGRGNGQAGAVAATSVRR